MNVVDRLVQVNFYSLEMEEKMLDDIRTLQYDRAITGFKLLQQAAQDEEAYLRKNKQWTAGKRQVLSTLKYQLKREIPPLVSTLKSAMKKKQFIYSARQPRQKPMFIRHTNVMTMPPTTSGRYKTEQ